MPDTCPQLQRANESRRRAWAQLQQIRKMLALVTEDLPPPPKPPDFEKEGQILRDALIKAVEEPWHLLNELEQAIEKIRPFMGVPLCGDAVLSQIRHHRGVY
jgi:hypothetical protein